MGAVFGIFAGFYYWLEKVVSLKYNQALAEVHFWTFFTSVNFTFFPMHFLGLSGMPRRISDYADSFAGWNALASLGSFCSIVSTILFFYIIQEMWAINFVNKKYDTWKHYFEKAYAKIPTLVFPFPKFPTLAVQFGAINFFITYDAPEDWQMNFQDPATPVMEKIIDLHHDIQYFLNYYCCRSFMNTSSYSMIF